MSPDSASAAIRRDALGIAAYAGAFGASFGAVAAATGLDLGQIMVLSMVMFTGASQFAFIGVIGAGGAPMAAIPAAMLLGLRNSFYGIPMARILGSRWRSPLRRAAAAHFVIDETTAMAVGRDEPAAQRYAFWACGIGLFALWSIGSLIGALGGAAIGDPAALGLDAAAPAAFLALLWPRLSDARSRVLALLGALIAVALIPFAPAGIPVLAAAPVAVVAAVLSLRGPRETPGGASR